MDYKIKIIFTTLFFSLVGCLPGILHAELMDKGFNFIYSLSKNDFTVAHVNRKLDVAVNKLTFTSHAYPVGLASLFVSETITEQSIINNTNDVLRPRSYSYIKKASEKIKKQHHVTFDWQNNLATDSRTSKAIKLAHNTFDNLSFQLALAKAIKTQQPNLKFTLLDNKKSKTYTLKINGEEQLETDAGPFTTVKVTYFDEAKRRKVTIWCAHQLDYLPVQVKRLDKDGDYATLKLLSLSPQTEVELEENSNDF